MPKLNAPATPTIIARLFRKQPEDDQADIRRLIESPHTQALLARVDADRLARRNVLAADRTRLRDERDREIPKLAANVQALTEDREKAWEAIRAAEQAEAEAASAYLTASCAYDVKIANVETELRSTADPALDELRAHLDELIAEVRKGSARISYRHEERNPFSLKMIGETFSNGPARARRMEALVAARRHVDALKLEPLSREALERRIEALLKSIPPYDSVEFTVRVEELMP